MNWINSSGNKLLDTKQVLEIIPISESNWKKGVKDGRYPKPVKVGGRVFWWTSVIFEFLNAGAKA